MRPRQVAKRVLIGGFLTQGLMSSEPVLLERLKAMRWHRLTTEPYARIPQILTDATWKRLTDLWENLARTLRSRPAASALASLIRDNPHKGA